MTAPRDRLRRPLLWVGVAILGAVVGATLHLVTSGDEQPVQVVAADGSPEPASAAAATAESTGSPATSPEPAATPPRAPEVGAAPLAGPAPQPAPRTDPTSEQPSLPAPPVVSNGLTLRIPALGVDAPVVTLGFAGDGQLDVPSDGATAGWYEISSWPGEPGNALIGAHFDWDGSLAVFASLNRLSTGDLVHIETESGDQATFEVRSAASIDWDHPVGDVLATDGSGSMLTLFTCGGAFDAARGEYEQRLIVQATRVDGNAPLTARR